MMQEIPHSLPLEVNERTDPVEGQEKSDVPSRDEFHARIKEIQAMERFERETAIPASDVDFQLTAISVVDQVARQHYYFGHPDQAHLVVDLFLQKLSEYCDRGLTTSDVLDSPETVDSIGRDVQKLLDSQGKTEIVSVVDREATTLDKFNARVLELDSSGLGAYDLLKTVRAEFADKLDDEVLAKIDRFSQLLSPEVVTNEKDRRTIDTLYAYKVGDTVATASFAGFVHEIYTDSFVSEETKIQIEEHFQIPRAPVETGRDLANETLRKSDDGQFIHDSPDNALEFRPGVKTFVDGQGDAKLVIENNSRTEPISMPPEALQDSESVAKLANYALVREMVYDELNQSVNLIGGEGLEDDLGFPSNRTLRRTYRFARLLLPWRTPDKILSSDELALFRSALRTFNPMGIQTEVGAKTALAKLGLIKEGTIDWGQTKRVGRLLRENRYFRAQEFRKPGLGHVELTKALKKGESKERSTTRREAA